MADFCNICLGVRFSENQNIVELMEQLSKYSGDIDINKLFNEYIVPQYDEFIKNPDLGLNVSGICEGCGLIRLSIEVNDENHYLKAHCYSNKTFLIAKIVADKKLEYNADEILKIYL